MYAAQLDKGPTGQVGAGLGLTISTAEVTLVPPTVHIGGPEHQPVSKAQWNERAYVIPWRPGLYQYEPSGVQLLFRLTPGSRRYAAGTPAGPGSALKHLAPPS
ncbi:hypothetical protein [Kitasatospora sp. NPDC054795]